MSEDALKDIVITSFVVRSLGSFLFQIYNEWVALIVRIYIIIKNIVVSNTLEEVRYRYVPLYIYQLSILMPSLAYFPL